ncbi:hypothetical protein J2Y89_001916 [Curtobacterium herbarum]|nr:hypothetical protein [Curtobacterium herbarum]
MRCSRCRVPASGAACRRALPRAVTTPRSPSAERSKTVGPDASERRFVTTRQGADGESRRRDARGGRAPGLPARPAPWARAVTTPRFPSAERSKTVGPGASERRSVTTRQGADGESRRRDARGGRAPGLPARPAPWARAVTTPRFPSAERSKTVGPGASERRSVTTRQGADGESRRRDARGGRAPGLPARPAPWARAVTTPRFPSAERSKTVGPGASERRSVTGRREATGATGVAQMGRQAGTRHPGGPVPVSWTGTGPPGCRLVPATRSGGGARPPTG